LIEKASLGAAGLPKGAWALYEAKEGSQLSMKFTNKLSSLGESVTVMLADDQISGSLSGEIVNNDIEIMTTGFLSLSYRDMK
jgi:hypothetical protein